MKTKQRAPKRKRSLSLEPQHISEDAWYYEERKGLHVIAYVPGRPGEAREVAHALISWKSLEESMVRYRAHKRASRATGSQS